MPKLPFMLSQPCDRSILSAFHPAPIPSRTSGTSVLQDGSGKRSPTTPIQHTQRQWIRTEAPRATPRSTDELGSPPTTCELGPKEAKRVYAYTSIGQSFSTDELSQYLAEKGRAWFAKES